MKLTGITPQMKGDNARVEARKNEVRARDVRRGAGAGDSTGDDRVQISSSTRDAAEMHRVLAATPEVRADRVAEVKERLESGAYDADPYKIADKLIASFLEENL